MLAQRARDNLCAIAFCALVGGQDELVFDGHSLVLDHHGEVIARAGQFSEELLLATIDVEAAQTQRLRDARQRAPAREARATVPTLAQLALPAPSAAAAPATRSAARSRRCSTPPAEVYAALVTGLRDYVRKNGFRRVVLGLSGGIDSALVACIAADALGPEGVAAVVMPSPYSSAETQADARTLAGRPRRRAVRAADRAGDAGLRRRARRRLRRHRARHRRGEPAGAHPRQPRDGALEQVRLARARDRQQVGDVGRLLDALRRPRRRPRGHQGLPEDDRSTSSRAG